MTSTRQKGIQFQNWCAKWLQEQGWTVYNQTSTPRAIKTGRGIIWVSGKQDLLGADILALKKPEKVLFIQATAHSAVQKRLDEFLKYPWPLEHATVQVWQKKDKEINIKEFDGQKLVDYAKIIRRKLYRVEPFTPNAYVIPPYDPSMGDQL